MLLFRPVAACPWAPQLQRQCISSTSFRGEIVRLGLSHKFGYTAAPTVYQ
jgi:hypothetical protein